MFDHVSVGGGIPDAPCHPFRAPIVGGGAFDAPWLPLLGRWPGGTPGRKRCFPKGSVTEGDNTCARGRDKGASRMPPPTAIIRQRGHRTCGPMTSIAPYNRKPAGHRPALFCAKRCALDGTHTFLFCFLPLTPSACTPDRCRRRGLRWADLPAAWPDTSEAGHNPSPSPDPLSRRGAGT